MKRFNQKRLWQIMLIFFELIMFIWCWSYMIFVILGEHYDSVNYYYDIKYLFIFKYTNYLLGLLIPFFYIYKTHYIYIYIYIYMADQA